MKINEFFASRLAAPLRNPRWSWGAHDETSDRIFLRVGEWAIGDDYADGKRWAIVYDPNFKSSHGHAERVQHLSQIQAGVEGYIVVVDFNEDGKIMSFDQNTLLNIGRIEEDGGLTYALITGESSIDDIAG